MLDRAVVIGRRVAQARGRRGMTQQQLATSSGVERSAIAKIENGTRRVSVVELVDLARELGERVEWFVEDLPATIASHRNRSVGGTVRPIDALVESLVRDVEFVQTESAVLALEGPAPMPCPRDDRGAEIFAEETRSLLGLDAADPAVDLDRRLQDLGLLAFSLITGGGADAATVLLASGGVAVVDGALAMGRRRLALAHELGHFLVQDPYTVDEHVGDVQDALEARLDRFARAVLLPADDLRPRWAEWSQRDGDRTAAVRAGHHYRVDMSTLARRLGELGIADRGAADLIRRVRITKSDIVEFDLVVPIELEPPSMPARYQRAVLDLFRREIITAARAVGLLHGVFGVADLPELPPVPEGEIWSMA